MLLFIIRGFNYKRLWIRSPLWRRIIIIFFLLVLIVVAAVTAVVLQA